MKIRSVGAELFHVDRQEDMKLTTTFRRFANASKKAGYESQRTNHEYSAVGYN
jgi:hypothetical protein